MRQSAEQERRRIRLVAEARRRQLDGVLVYSWRRRALAWLTGYDPGFVTNYAALWLPEEGPPVLAIRFPYDVERALRLSGLDVRVDVSPVDLVPEGVARIGLIGGDFAIDETPPALLAGLAARGVEVVDLAPLLDDWRAIKSEAEVHAASEAAGVAAVAIAAAGEAAHEGDGDYEIVGRVEGAARAAGAERALCLVGIGDGACVSEPLGTAVGPQDPVLLETTLWVAGSCTQATTTLPPVRKRPHDTRAHAVCVSARRELLDALRPGTLVDEVVARGDAVLEHHRLLRAKEYDFGHGIGADTPEQPRLVAGTGRSIEAGMVLTVHVAIRRSGGETAFGGGPLVVESTGPRELVAAAPWIS